VIGLAVTFGTVVGGINVLSDMGSSTGPQIAEGELTSVQEDHAGLIEGSYLRSSEVQLSETSLFVDEDDTTTFEISVSGPGTSYTEQIESTPIVIGSGDSARVVSHGAIIVDQDEGSSMAETPLFDIRDSRTILPLVDVEQAGGGRQVSGGQATITSYRSDMSATTLNPVNGGTNAYADVEIVIASSRYRAWNNYFRSLPHDITVTMNEGQEEVVVEFSTREIAIQVIETNIRVES
jgi:hypothetical protein